MYRLITLIMVLSAFPCYSQEKEKINLFFDETNKQVDALTYFKKCSSFLYLCNKQKRDSIIINSTFELYKFGKLNEIETSQVRKLLKKNTGSERLDHKTIIISFRDIIYGHEEQKTLDRTISFDKHNYFSQSKSKYLSRRKKHDINQKKCLKKFKKQNIAPIYLYKIDKGYNYISKNLKWNKVHPVIDRFFFNYKYPIMLIIKPDGNYFRYLSISDVKLNNLLEKDWTPYIKGYQIAKVNLLKNKNVFFNDISVNIEKRTFYIDNKSRSLNDGTHKELPKSLPKNAIIIRDRSEIRKYLNKQVRCFSYASF